MIGPKLGTVTFKTNIPPSLKYQKTTAIMADIIKQSKKSLKMFLGESLVTLFPKEAKSLSKRGMTIVNQQELNPIHRLMRFALLTKAETNKDFEQIAAFQQNYWKNRGTYFFKETESRFETIFLKEYAYIFELLNNKIIQSKKKYNLIEIGTGNGKVLNYLSKNLKGIGKLIGIDLSKEQTEINKLKFSNNPQLSFISTNGYDYIIDGEFNNTIFVTSGGVLEYFTQNQLETILNKLSSFENIIFVAIEPKGVHHNFKTNTNTEIYGHERSFSHNYPHLFKKAGFSIWHEKYNISTSVNILNCFIGAEIN